MYQGMNGTGQLYTYDLNDRNESGRTVRPMSRRQRKIRQERLARRRRKRRIRMLVVFMIYMLMAAAVAGGLYFLGRGIESLGRLIAGTAPVSAVLNGQDGEGTGNDVFAADEQEPLICLDAGHGGKDQGTSYQQILEKDINLAVAKKVKRLLEDAGYRTMMTRDTDEKVDKYERSGMANREKADVFVSIHCNFLESGEASGIEIYYDAGRKEGGILAEKVLKEMVAQTGAKNRGVRLEDFVVTRETKMPSILVELGYLSDASERAKMMTDSYQNLLAKGIAGGVMEYIK